MYTNPAALSGAGSAALQTHSKRPLPQGIRIKSISASSEAELQKARARIDAFVSRLSPDTIFSRTGSYRMAAPEMRGKWVERLIEGVRQGKMLACVAEQGGQVVGLTEGRRYSEKGTQRMDIATVVADGLQGRGIGIALRNKMEEQALQEGIQIITATLMNKSREAERAMQRAGYSYIPDEELWIKDLTKLHARL